MAEADVGAFFQLVIHYGYLIVAIAALVEAMPLIGWLVPGQAIIIVAGAVAAAGHLNVVILILVAIPAGILGDAAGFYIGRRYGRGFLEKYGPRLRIGPQHMARSDALFAKYGAFALIFARFSFLTRAVGPILAGMARMRARVFWPINVLGAIAWSVTYCLFGYFLGVGFLALQARVGRILAFTVVAVIGLYLFYRVLRKYASQFTRDDLYIVLVAAAAGTVFGLIADHVQEAGVANAIDAPLPVLQAFFAPAAPVLDAIAVASNMFVLGGLALGAVAFFFLRRSWWDATLYALGVGGILVLLAILRPLFLAALPEGAGQNWPSPSSAVPVVLAGVLTYQVSWRTDGPLATYLTALFSGIVAALAAWSRMMHGDATPSAVFAGLTLGIAWLSVTILVVEFRLKSGSQGGDPSRPRA